MGRITTVAFAHQNRLTLTWCFVRFKKCNVNKQGGHQAELSQYRCRNLIGRVMSIHNGRFEPDQGNIIMAKSPAFLR